MSCVSDDDMGTILQRGGAEMAARESADAQRRLTAPAGVEPQRAEQAG